MKNNSRVTLVHSGSKSDAKHHWLYLPCYLKLLVDSVSGTIARGRHFQSVSCSDFRACRLFLKCPWKMIKENKFVLCL